MQSYENGSLIAFLKGGNDNLEIEAPFSVDFDENVLSIDSDGKHYMIPLTSILYIEVSL